MVAWANQACPLVTARAFLLLHTKKLSVSWAPLCLLAPHCTSGFATTGVDYLEKSIDTESGETVKLMVWDTAGQEEFDALTAGYYRGEKRGILEG
jgi:GTPase SAR1 family protein